MSSPALETVNQLFLKLKANPEAEVSTLCEQTVESFPGLIKEDQNDFSSVFYKWAAKNKTKHPLIFCYARHLKLANNFFSEQHETVLAEAPALQEAFRENNEPAAVAAVGVLIGSIHRTLGNVDLSLKSLWDAYDQLNRLNRFQHYKTACSFHIGSIYVELNNNEEAFSILQKTLALAKKAKDSIMTVYTLHGLGKMYLKEKNYENARLMFGEAMEAANNAAVPSLVSSAETEMGNYYFETGNYDESEILHTKAVETRVANQFIGGAITNYIRLAEINMKQSQPDDAIAVLNKGLALAEQIKVKPKMYQIHLLLSEIYHCKNDLGKSLFHYKQYHYLKDQAGQEDNAKKIKNVRLVFEAEQTKKENSIIKKQKAEIQEKNIELQDTIDELTITKASKKAKAFTLLIAIVFFIFEDSILHFVFHFLPADNFWFSLGVKMAIIFSLKPINGVIEHYLVRKVIRKKKKALEEEDSDSEISSDLDFAA
jgi:tetratricopeptide (TPR) repeat protein